MRNKDNVIIILDRHPESLGNASGDNRFDPKIGITERGKEQARAQADFMMREYFPRIGVTSLDQVQIWASDYNRVQQGLNEKLKRIQEIDPDFITPNQIIHSDDMLIERNFGDLAYIEHLLHEVFKDDEEAQKSILTDLAKGKAVHEGVPHSAKPAHGESPKEIGAYTRLWRESLERDVRDGARIHWVMTHGDVIKQIVAKQLHQHHTPLKAAGNCDVLEISGPRKNSYVQRVYDGQAMCATFDSPRYYARPRRVGDLPFARERPDI